MKTHPRPCHACETGTIRPTNLRGRAFDYRDERDLLFDADVVAPVCDGCGELYLKGEVTQQFSDVLERLRLERKRAAAQHFIETAEREFSGVPRAVWEDTFGLSRGYLSRLAAGTRVADTPLEILLEGFARQPKMALRLLVAAGHAPKALAAFASATYLRSIAPSAPATSRRR